MHLFAEFAQSEKDIHTLQGPFEQSRIAPPLRRPFMCESASQTARLRADFAVEFEENVHGTDQPVFVHGVELDCPAVFKNLRAEQGDVVIVNDIEPLFENLPDATCLKKRESA